MKKTALLFAALLTAGCGANENKQAINNAGVLNQESVQAALAAYYQKADLVIRHSRDFFDIAVLEHNPLYRSSDAACFLAMTDVGVFTAEKTGERIQTYTNAVTKETTSQNLSSYRFKLTELGERLFVDGKFVLGHIVPKGAVGIPKIDADMAEFGLYETDIAFTADIDVTLEGIDSHRFKEALIKYPNCTARVSDEIGQTIIFVGSTTPEDVSVSGILRGDSLYTTIRKVASGWTVDRNDPQKIKEAVEKRNENR